MTPKTVHWSDEETDNPLLADDRNYYKVEKWTKDGAKVDRMLYAGSSLAKSTGSLCVGSQAPAADQADDPAANARPARVAAEMRKGTRRRPQIAFSFIRSTPNFQILRRRLARSIAMCGEANMKQFLIAAITVLVSASTAYADKIFHYACKTQDAHYALTVNSDRGIQASGSRTAIRAYNVPNPKIIGCGMRQRRLGA
jgi:hypothetical protein